MKQLADAFVKQHPPFINSFRHSEHNNKFLPLLQPDLSRPRLQHYPPRRYSEVLCMPFGK